jgi:signal transduction histidine kinase
MVKNIIEKHQGQVSLKSEEGKGTEVSFTLPIRKN